MEELCPDALLLNYANPMAACCYALGKVSRKIQFIGLCHGVQTTMDLISRYVGRPREEIDYLCAGINHMAWFLSLKDRRSRQDLYPVLRRNIERPEYYANEKVRCEVMRHFGYFMTESTGHLSEYLPWFRSSERALKLYCDEPDFGGESGAYYKYASGLADKYQGVNYLESESADLGEPSVEYCAHILEAKETGKLFRLNGNVRNDGFISNLTPGCCVEVPVQVDERGFHPDEIGDLPPQLAALNQSNITVQTLTVEASLTGDPEHVVHAIAVDPLTSACCTLREIREMTAEMLEKQRHWLPQFAGKQLRKTAAIHVPTDIKRVDVPLDPALAIANRFAELAERQIHRK
jgi:alpha-galactosidase